MTRFLILFQVHRPDIHHQEETFGPVIGIQKVASDVEAIALMNDSPYGLTASVWTDASSNPDSEAAFMRFVEEVETGTVFLNRCVFSSFLALFFFGFALSW